MPDKRINLRKTMNIKAQKKLALALLEWHGGMSSGLYAVGSCMLSDSEKGVAYAFHRHHGHELAIGRAVAELREMKARANYPDAVSAKDEKECNGLADKLGSFLPEPVVGFVKVPKELWGQLCCLVEGVAWDAGGAAQFIGNAREVCRAIDAFYGKPAPSGEVVGA
jgi:hypothetical protein